MIKNNFLNDLDGFGYDDVFEYFLGRQILLRSPSNLVSVVEAAARMKRRRFDNLLLENCQWLQT